VSEKLPKIKRRRKRRLVLLRVGFSHGRWEESYSVNHAVSGKILKNFKESFSKVKFFIPPWAAG
jgi:hypothetical protein